MGCTTWVTCVVLYWFVFELCHGVSSASSSLPLIKYHQDANKSNSASTGLHWMNSLSEQNSDVSREKVRSMKTRTVDENGEALDGFEFVDPPDDSTETRNVVSGVTKANKAIIGNGGGKIDKNVWQSYPNGTIVHDLRISVVHPANMVGGAKEGHFGDSDRIISNNQGRAYPAPRHDGSEQSTTFTPKSSSEGRSDSLPVSKEALDQKNVFPNSPKQNSGNGSNLFVFAGNDAEANESDTFTSTPTITYGSVIARNDTDENVQPLNVEIPFNVSQHCFYDCLSKCPTAGSDVDQALILPYCPHFPNDSIVTSTASVPLYNRRSYLDDVSKFKDSFERKFDLSIGNICLSESCVLKSADILRRIDKSVDPCDSFYKFACGGYFKNGIPSGDFSRSIFSDISFDIISRMHSVLRSPELVDDKPAVKLLKTVYSECRLVSQKELLADALQRLGGWPSADNNSLRALQNIWGEIAFNWTYGMYLEYNLVSINLTFSNESDVWVLNVDYPQFVKVALRSGSSVVLDEIEYDIKRVAAALGIDSDVGGVLEDLRIFMGSAIRYAEASMFSVEKGSYTLKDLRTRFTHLDVIKKLPSLLKTAVVINDDEIVFVSDMKYLRKIDELLRDSTVKTQASHLVLTALRSWSLLLGSTDRDPEIHCVKLAGNLFPRLYRNLYSSTFVSLSTVASATKIVSHLRSSLLHILDENGHNPINYKVMDKVKKLKFVWGSPEESIGRNYSIDKNPSFLELVKTGIWDYKMTTYAYLHHNVIDTLSSLIELYSENDDVNAFYYAHNVFIPSTALHESIFNPNLPPYVSYGGLGLLVGHELIHSVITVGDLTDSARYKNSENCFIYQFNKFIRKHSGRENGLLTKDENIADYGGFKVAYHAFMEWYNHSSQGSEERRLPGLHAFNEKQMFWLTAATNLCQKINTNFVCSPVDIHAPLEYRIDGQLVNIPEFAQDFNCPNNSPMNPEEKCFLW